MTTTRSREAESELLGTLPTADLVRFAGAIAARADALSLLRLPETGSVVLQVREPIARQRFQLADMTVTTAEVDLDGTRGWAMRPGGDAKFTLAQAICEAELAREGVLAEELREALDAAAAHRDHERAAEWRRLAATIVEFEEVM